MEITNKSIQPNYKKAEASALDLIDKYNIREPIVDVFMICEQEGFVVECFIATETDIDARDVDGAFFRGDKKILINSDRPPKRIAFTLAHELGHAIMHTDVKEDILLRDGRSSLDDYREKEANKFAACLLMPKHMIQHQMQRLGISSSCPDLLADLFGVSLQSMIYRLKNLKWK